MKNISRGALGGCLSVFLFILLSVTDAGSAIGSSKSNILNSYETGISLPAHFPEPSELKPNVDFWTDVYTKYESSKAIVHDSVNLGIVYEVVDLKQTLGKSYRHKTKNRYMAKRKKHYARLLRKLSKRKGVCRTNEECRVVRLFGDKTGRKVFREAARSVRVQYGLADRFPKGLEASGLYMEDMRRIFASHGMPFELLALPHVESSFNVKAYSKYGAAGIWQFTRSTGRLFMKINYSVDERRDPLMATDAAARLLKKNYEKLESWPLAITAYNHGRRGMETAKRRYGDDIVSVMKNYRSRTFGFASRNFYTEFLAAKKIMDNPEYYFGRIVYEPSLKYEEVKVPDFLPANLISRHFGFDKKRIASLNPALRRSVWLGTRYIPKGYRLKVPEGSANIFNDRYKTIPTSKLFKNQKRPNWYKVRRGDSLSTIATRFRTTVPVLQAYNGIDNKHRIYQGQKLRIPGRNGKSASVKVAKVEKKKKRTVKKKAEPLNKKAVALNKSLEPAKKRVETVAYGAPAGKPIKLVSMALLSIPVATPPISAYRFENVFESYGVIMVRPEETVGHYSYWSGVSVRKIMRLNGWNRRKHIRLGQKVKIPLNRVTTVQFETSRYEYHLSVFEDFFSAYKVDRVDTLEIERGQSLWTLCNDDYDVPVWLVRLYNHGETLKELKPGQKIRMPIVEKRSL